MGEHGDRTSEIYFQKGKLCNAGATVAEVKKDGTVVTCLPLQEKIGNIYTGINFKKHMVRCPLAKCGCPLKFYDNRVWNKALANNKGFMNRHVWANVRRMQNSKRHINKIPAGIKLAKKIVNGKRIFS